MLASLSPSKAASQPTYVQQSTQQDKSNKTSSWRRTHLEHPRPEDLRPHTAILDAVCVQLWVPEKKQKKHVEGMRRKQCFSLRARCCFVQAWGPFVSECVIGSLAWGTLDGLAVQAFVKRDTRFSKQALRCWGDLTGCSIRELCLPPGTYCSTPLRQRFLNK